jgi:hypothetical protein
MAPSGVCWTVYHTTNKIHSATNWAESLTTKSGSRTITARCIPRPQNDAGDIHQPHPPKDGYSYGSRLFETGSDWYLRSMFCPRQIALANREREQANPRSSFAECTYRRKLCVLLYASSHKGRKSPQKGKKESSIVPFPVLTSNRPRRS